MDKSEKRKTDVLKQYLQIGKRAEISKNIVKENLFSILKTNALCYYISGK